MLFPNNSAPLKAVIETTTPCLIEGDWAQALVASHCILHRLDEQSATFAQGPNADIFTAPLIQRLASWLYGISCDLFLGHSYDDIVHGMPVPTELLQQPRGLTLALEHLCFHERGMPNGNDTHKTAAELDSFVGPHDLNWLAQATPDSGSNDADNTYWIVRRALSFPVSSTEQRALHPQHFLAHTRIVAKHQPNGFRVLAVPSDPVLDELMPANGPQGETVKVMIAHFARCALESSLRATPDGSIAFKARAVRNTDAICAELRAHWPLAREHNVDFIVLPELTIDPACARFIEELQRDEQTCVPNLRLAFCGSFHRNTGQGDAVENVALVLDRNGHALPDWSHVKTQFVDLRKRGQPKVYEDIAIAKTISLFDTNWGVHCGVICLDFAQGDANQVLWERLPINWLWAPAMSEATTAFKGPAKRLTLNSPCTVTIANQANVDFGVDSTGRPVQLTAQEGANDNGGFVALSAGLEGKRLPLGADDGLRAIYTIGPLKPSAETNRP